MANTKLLAVFALLQVLSLHIHGASAATKHKPKPGGGGTCQISGFLHGKSHKCNRENGSDCCVTGQHYPQFKCSPPVTTSGGPKTKSRGCHIHRIIHKIIKISVLNKIYSGKSVIKGLSSDPPTANVGPPLVTAKTRAILTLNSFAAGGDGGGESFCDKRFHKDSDLVVALSTGWLRLDGKGRCNKMIRVSANGRSVLAKVVDECDSVNGCDAEHNFEPPCANNVVDGSPAVWKALGLEKKENVGEVKVTWSDV